MIEIEIFNPSKFDAKVKLLSEWKNQMLEKYGYNPNIGWEVIDIKAGEKKRIKIKKSN